MTTAIGYYDSVRKSADTEFRKRLEAVTGKPIPALVEGAPLMVMLSIIFSLWLLRPSLPFLAATFPDRLADCRRYIDWVEGDDSPRPLARGDQKAIAESGAWFARKFALTHDVFFLRLPPYS